MIEKKDERDVPTRGIPYDPPRLVLYGGLTVPLLMAISGSMGVPDGLMTAGQSQKT